MSAEPRQKQDDALVLALARGESISKAAQLSGWSPRTVQRRMAEPGFAQQVRTARADLIGRASDGLADASSEAVQTLRQLLRADSESVRLSAAKNILDLACRYRETVEVEDRLAALEKVAEEDHESQVTARIA